MEIEVGRNASRARGLGIAGLVFAALLVMVDFVALRGERVDGGFARLTGDRPARLEIQRVGEEHLVEISTRRLRQGETRGRSIDYRLEAPDGRVIVDESELVSRKDRYLSFEPTVAGEYLLYAKDQGLLGASTDSASVDVYIGDRRVLRRFSF